jgi:hypothetical protein
MIFLLFACGSVLLWGDDPLLSSPLLSSALVCVCVCVCVHILVHDMEFMHEMHVFTEGVKTVEEAHIVDMI